MRAIIIAAVAAFAFASGTSAHTGGGSGAGHIPPIRHMDAHRCHSGHHRHCPKYYPGKWRRR
jgi:hypothetical protein